MKFSLKRWRAVFAAGAAALFAGFAAPGAFAQAPAPSEPALIEPSAVQPVSAAAASAAAPAPPPAPTPPPPPVAPPPARAPGGARGAAPASSAANDAAKDGYILGARDRIRMIVFGEPNLSGEFVVDGIGRIALPLVGEIQALNKSVRAFERDVEAILRQGYLNDPRVSVEVLNYRPFYILGEVSRPGEYPYTSGLTVFNAVATAGGFTALANQTRALIRRAGETTETDMSLLEGAVVVGPGDTIRIVKGAFYILGEVNRAGEYPFSAGMTVNNAVASAGGFTYRANKSRVHIKHQGEDKERRYKLTPSLPLKPGDTVRIGERLF